MSMIDHEEPTPPGNKHCIALSQTGITVVGLILLIQLVVTLCCSGTESFDYYIIESELDTTEVQIHELLKTMTERHGDTFGSNSEDEIKMIKDLESFVAACDVAIVKMKTTIDFKLYEQATDQRRDHNLIGTQIDLRPPG
jgi:hypothetical protein